MRFGSKTDPEKYTGTTLGSDDDATDGVITEGDRVVITVAAEELQQLQKSRSGWAVGMTQVGVVLIFTHFSNSHHVR